MAAAADETYLHRVVTVLAAFQGEENAVGAAELARRTGLPKSTVHRIVLALVGERLLERHAAKVRLSVRLFELAKELARIRRAGVAYDHEESGLGIVCAASPVLGIDSEVLGALSVSGWSGRMRLDHVSPAVHTAALALSRTLRAAG